MFQTTNQSCILYVMLCDKPEGGANLIHLILSKDALFFESRLSGKALKTYIEQYVQSHHHT